MSQQSTAAMSSAPAEETGAPASPHHLQRLEALGQLTCGIAHEINTPAQFVSDNVRFLQNEFVKLMSLIEKFEALVVQDSCVEYKRRQIGVLQGEIDFAFLKSELPQAFAQSLEGLERITTIVRAMKDFAHPGVAAKEPADIGKLIGSTVEVCRNQWKYIARLEMAVQPDLPLVPCLSAELKQVLLNLVVNAADAIAERYGSNCDKIGLINVTARRVDDLLEIRVSDDGAGIAPQHRRRMFEQFFTTKPPGKGTGQGLPLCRDVVVSKHGGRITFESTEGVGTTFIVTIPLSDPDLPHADLFTDAEAA